MSYLAAKLKHFQCFCKNVKVGVRWISAWIRRYRSRTVLYCCDFTDFAAKTILSKACMAN